MSTTFQLEAGAVKAEVAPFRGGMLTRLQVGGDQILYLDEATLADLKQKVRGGVPILFPTAGRLEGDTYQVEGRPFHLPQHGLARDLPWDLVSADARSCEVRHASTEATLAAFPFQFDFRITYRAAGNTLTIEQVYSNLGTQPMPLHVGFHPYFYVPDADKGKVTISTDATRAFDQVAGKEIELGKIDLTADEVNLVLLDHDRRDTIIERPGRRAIRMAWDAPLRNLVVWTKKGQDFVCVEPWSAPPNALNTGTNLLHIGPREMRKSFLAITGME